MAITLVWIDHVWDCNSHHYSQRGLSSCCDTNRLRSDPCGGHLTKNDEADWSKRAAVAEIPD